MEIGAIKYSLINEKLKNQFVDIKCGQKKDLSELKENSSISLFILHDNYLEKLCNYHEIVVYKGNKHEKVPLSRYLLGCKKIPVVNSGFKRVVQVHRSIRDLLKRAHQQDDRNIYLLGVNDEIFGLLRETVNDFDELQRENLTKDQGYSNPQKTSEDHDDPLPNLFLGNSDQTHKIRSFIRCAAESDDEVLILGETGTGKEVIAKAIHLLRHGNLEKMQVINCAAISESLLESELFGYKKGAFTGADRDRKGLWEISQGGTLFLDEIGDLSPNHQAKILRALAEKKIRPVGSSSQVGVNARIIAATNVDLVSRVISGEFRDDLYYRLNTFPIFVPPLRDRREDIAILALTFWSDITSENVPPLSKEVHEELKNRDWPGNVRVLHSFLRCLRTLNYEKLSQGKAITIKDIHFAFAYHGQQNFLLQSGVSSEDVRLHPAHCLRRLKRASDIFFSIRLAITALLESQDRKRMHQDSILNNIRELQMLCNPKDAALFHSVPTLNEVCGFADQMKKIEEELFVAPNDHSASWFALSERLSRVMEIVFDEIERITS